MGPSASELEGSVYSILNDFQKRSLNNFPTYLSQCLNEPDGEKAIPFIYSTATFALNPMRWGKKGMYLGTSLSRLCYFLLCA